MPGAQPAPRRKSVFDAVRSSSGWSRSGWARTATLLFAELLSLGLVVLLLSSAVFLALRLVPGDPTSLILGDDASAHARHQLRQRLGLDQPLAAQWLQFVSGVIAGEWGESLAKPGVSALSAVARACVPTASLAAVAVVQGSVGGILLAVASVAFAERTRAIAHAAMLLSAAVPLLAFGPLLTWVLAVRYAVVPLPGDPDSGVRGLVFASTLLSIPLGAQVSRVARAALLDQSRARYLDVARAKGAGPGRVWLLHALPVAAPAIIVVIAMQLGALLGGAVVLERLFERPGLGTLMLEAYRCRDLPILQASIVSAGMLFVVAQSIAQVIQRRIDPSRNEMRHHD
jgi:ABC-type dipeptide/oligopeptide/nickel transport system permease component